MTSTRAIYTVVQVDRLWRVMRNDSKVSEHRTRADAEYLARRYARNNANGRAELERPRGDYDDP